MSSHPCFNRNIVECKCRKIFWCGAREMVLIETLWNVNSSKESASSLTLRFNRNIVECKYKAEEAVLPWKKV